MVATLRKIEIDEPWVVSWLVFAVAAICFHGIFSVFFPNQDGMLGHDYSLIAPNLYDGLLWFHNNSLFEVPWFTPSFCGGQPFFADPQSGYYSLTQWLAFFFAPVTAIYLSLLFYASLAYWGMYLLCRNVFLLSVSAACFAAVVFMFNGFLTHRLIIGHIGFYGIVLIPWIAMLLVTIKEIPIGPIKSGGNALLAGLLVAYWLQSGMGSLVVPAALSILLVIAIVGARDQLDLRTFLVRSLLAGLTAVALSAAKLNAALSYLSHFPRDSYKLPGADGLASNIELIFRSLAFSSQSTFEWSLGVMQNQQWHLRPHEWSYGLTPVPMLLVGVGLVILLGKLPRIHFKSPLVIISVFVAALVVVLPVVLNIYTQEWNAILKRTPIIANSSSMVRWFLIYIPVLALLAAISIDHIPMSSKARGALVAICLVLVVGFKAFEDRSYYFGKGASYGTAAPTAAWQAASLAAPKLEAVGLLASRAELVRNDVIFDNTSQLNCYNPVFGYRLENYPRGTLREGAPTMISDGVFNLKNPACYLFPEENQCEPGDHFQESEAEPLELFVNYRPFKFEVSHRQEVFNVMTTLSLLIATLLLLVMMFWPFVRLMRTTISRSK